MAGRASRPLVRRLVATAHELRQRFAAELAAGSSSLLEVRDSVADALSRDVSADETADILAQTAACAAPILAIGSVPDWLLDQLSSWERFAFDEARLVGWDQRAVRAPAHHCAAGGPSAAETALSHPTAAHLYESFFHLYAAKSRKRRGVFFTPEPIAAYIVAQIDQLLINDFHLPDGLASHSAPRTPHSALPSLLDPACGTGIFLLAAIDHIDRSLTTKWTDEGCGDAERHRCWNAFVPDLLQRLVGIEILPAAALLTKLNLTLKLAQTGFNFQSPCSLNILCGDALSPAIHSALRTPRSAFPVLLGNPPFSSLSTNTNPWIAQLVRGDDEIRGYANANGQRLGERKTWLHDDYVKFIRLAQWHVEQAGCGIVGFVTSHGYLDNATFRLMRSELLRVFPRIRILDLHGSRKNHEVAPGGGRDENVFALDQGLAIGLFCRGVGVPPAIPPRIEHADLWGTRESKLASLADPSLALRACVIAPLPPHWRFTPSPPARSHPEYAAAWSLADAMPVNTPAPVTARDHFVVAFTREELEQRIAEFRDLSIPDDEIRRRYFTRTRSARYEPGDTRSWKLSAARQIIAADADWQRRILRCLYRPFDWRYVFWHPAMIDWPRREVTRHLVEPECGMQNAECGVKAIQPSSGHSALRTPHSALCLLARRQQLPTQPCTFFWISDGLALDGVIRSDNRGSESLFPLYVIGSRFKVQGSKLDALPTLNLEPGTLNLLEPNFAPTFLEQLSATIGRQPQPEETLAYIYALFHSPTYRERYADQLHSDFPRVLLPRTAGLFNELAPLGQRLIRLHLLRHPNRALSTEYSALNNSLLSSTPHSALPTPHLHSPSPSPSLPLSPSVREFRAGGYVALKKWLQPKHRTADDPEYAKIVGAVSETLALMREIDWAIDRQGGWEAAFVAR